jgi:alpha-D-ribose 1-methylphosphonate 5-triphosphate synthase subunit PhnL
LKIYTKDEVDALFKMLDTRLAGAYQAIQNLTSTVELIKEAEDQHSALLKSFHEGRPKRNAIDNFHEVVENANRHAD